MCPSLSHILPEAWMHVWCKRGFKNINNKLALIDEFVMLILHKCSDKMLANKTPVKIAKDDKLQGEDKMPVLSRHLIYYYS